MFLGLVVVIISLLLIFFWKRSKGKINENAIPGPKGLPFFGCAFEFDDSTMPIKLSKYVKKFGNIFQMKIFTNDFVVLSSGELVKKAYCSEEYKHYMNDRAPVYYMDCFRANGQTTVFANGKIHHALRKYFHKGLHTYGDGIETLEENVMTEIKNLLSRIEDISGQEFSLTNTIQQSLANVVSSVLSGEPTKDSDLFWEHFYIDEFLLGTCANFILNALPVFRFLPGQYGRKIRRLKELDTIVGKRYWYQQKETYVPGKVRGLADHYIAVQQKHNSTNNAFVLNDTHIISQLNEVIDAGMATSSTAILNSFAILLNYPECQKKIQLELDRVIGRDRFPSTADRDNCDYLRAFESEVHRYIPVLPVSLPHLCSKDIEFEGFSIKANTSIMVNIWHIHHDEKVWGDPWNFRPERFLDEDGLLLTQDSSFYQNLMPFGIGPRICPGQVFARTRYFLYIASLLQKWSFEFPPNQSVSCDPRNVENFVITLLMRIKSLNSIAKRRI